MKRIVTLALAMMMTIICCLGAASAVSVEDAGTRASLTLSDYNAVLKAGTTSGEIRISYTVLASKPADSVGVSSITIYKSDGSHVTTITGTTGNGLILNSDVGHYVMRFLVDTVRSSLHPIIDIVPCSDILPQEAILFYFVNRSNWG